MTNFEILRKYVDAADVSDATIEKVAEFSQIRKFAAGETLVRGNRPADSLFIVVEGQVDIQVLLKTGKRQTFDTLAPGDFLNWAALVKPYTTNLIGVCRAETKMLAINAEKLRALCEEDTLFGYRLVSQMARVIRRRLQASRKQVVDLDA